MADKTNIEWTDATWNPIRGCSRVSAGCQNCYAERVASRFSGAGQPYEGLIHPRTKGWNGSVKLVPEALQIPWRWSRGRRIFVNSMSDLFHPEVPFEYIAAVFFIMAHTTRHTYQVLTKRPDRMLEFFRWALLHQPEWSDEPAEDWDNSWVEMNSDYGRSCMNNTISDVGRKHPAVEALGWTPHREGKQHGGYDNCGPGWPYFNVWLGVSVEDQATADQRIPLLLQTPAAVRWISAEPLLGPIDLQYPESLFGADGPRRCCDGRQCGCMGQPIEPPLIYGLNWVVAGGESGPGARPMHPAWARSLRDQCAGAGIPFLFKQHGEWLGLDHRSPCIGVDTLSDSLVARVDGRDYSKSAVVGWTEPGDHRLTAVSVRVGKKAAGRLLDGVQHDAYPEVA